MFESLKSDDLSWEIEYLWEEEIPVQGDFSGNLSSEKIHWKVLKRLNIWRPAQHLRFRVLIIF